MFASTKKWRPAIVIMFAFMLLAGCGSESDAGTKNEASKTAGSSPAAGEAETIVYKDALDREVTIPAHPQRIVTTQYLSELLAIGVKPIGVVTHMLTGSVSAKEELEGIEDIGPANNINLEKTLELRPDLIIAADWDKDQLDKLQAIAPTVVVAWEGKDAFAHLDQVAALLDKTEIAKDWRKAFDKKAAAASEKLKAFVKPGETFGVVVIGGYEKGQLRVYGPGNVGYTLFDVLGFPMTDVVKREWDKGGHELGIRLSLEKLPEFASADRLFLVKFDNDPDFTDEVMNSALWKKLPAVQSGHVYEVSDTLWFSYNALSFDKQLDDAVRLLAE
ncbi:ABC transporter substrate-binding protein [Cohnella rhizosphaerae]|uniref:ABC transporter substrate-binding protein n=1 Tax=Cohnella rhizosphaerae TaxID=1457232 RepID=A0A9X4KVC5_9BACL|nr:ABC transporter substrate-binding protein [Cohnella rhizosphaerae]MDG0808732.1 ABC transporter substrate-binding protein [Cohnella rhizosphaerae]